MTFHSVGNGIIPTDEFSIIFQRGFGIPPTSVSFCRNSWVYSDENYSSIGFSKVINQLFTVGGAALYKSGKLLGVLMWVLIWLNIV
jgi:hypothetical protein